jgi:hypothetical protein
LTDASQLSLMSPLELLSMLISPPQATSLFNQRNRNIQQNEIGMKKTDTTNKPDFSNILLYVITQSPRAQDRCGLHARKGTTL